MDRDQSRRAYWKANVRTVIALLCVWAFVSFGCSILFVDALNKIRIPNTGFKLGFWFAQQGSIYVFVILIFVYVRRMNRLDKEHDVDEDKWVTAVQARPDKRGVVHHIIVSIVEPSENAESSFRRSG